MVVDIDGNAFIGNFGFNTYDGEEIKPTNLILVRPGEEPVWRQIIYFFQTELSLRLIIKH